MFQTEEASGVSPMGDNVWERLWDPGAPPKDSHWWTRFAILRLLGLVYFFAFWTIVQQGLPLFGSEGLLPATDYLARVSSSTGSAWNGFRALPSLFWFSSTDGALMLSAWIGVALSLVVVCGYANGFILLELWILYMSFVHIGQDWYGFGWESQLLETGLLALFLVPFWDGRAFPGKPPPRMTIWLFRWLIVRIMLGAGLIKLRGDPCWSDLTCLAYHYETQPIPNPLSFWLHFMPAWFHKLGALFNHFVELVVPWFVLGPRRTRVLAGGFLVGFQCMLIASGNLSFLNWLTIVPALACFDDRVWSYIVPARWYERSSSAGEKAQYSTFQIVSVTSFAILVVFLSVNPVSNLLSPHQAMNTSFDRLHLVNSYGAFGSVGKERLELVFEGTLSETPVSDDDWKPYEFKCKPGALDRRPCVLSPYHYRLDWLLWFAAMGSSEQYPWTLHVVWKLLNNDRGLLSLMEVSPFGDQSPRFIRVQRFRYRFARPGEGGWWKRERLGSWLPPLSIDNLQFRRVLAARGWAEPL